MTFVKLLLNLPWSLMMLIAAVVSVPKKVFIREVAVVFEVKSFWWYPLQGARAMTLGNIILLSPRIENNDLKHELIHVEQFMREPFIHPFFSIYQILRFGHRNSIYEREAYTKAENIYKL